MVTRSVGTRIDRHLHKVDRYLQSLGPGSSGTSSLWDQGHQAPAVSGTRVVRHLQSLGPGSSGTSSLWDQGHQAPAVSGTRGIRHLQSLGPGASGTFSLWDQGRQAPAVSGTRLQQPISGFPQRFKSENGHGKLMEHEKLAKSHGILPILSLNCTKFVSFFCNH